MILDTYDHDQGYHRDLFVNDSTKLTHYECCICLNLLRNPVQCNEGHLFCFQCIKVSKQVKCPECRTQLTLPIENLSKNLFVKKQIMELPIKCSTLLNNQIKSECNWENGTLSKLQHHLTNECLYVTVKCPSSNKGCSFVCQRKDMNQHIRTCSYSLLKTCINENQGCSFTGRLEYINIHEKNCIYRQISCPNQCGLEPLSFCYKDLKNHLLKCPNQIIDCPLFLLNKCCQKCPQKCERKKVESHVSASENTPSVMTCLDELVTIKSTYKPDDKSFTGKTLFIIYLFSLFLILCLSYICLQF